MYYNIASQAVQCIHLKHTVVAFYLFTSVRRFISNSRCCVSLCKTCSMQVNKQDNMFNGLGVAGYSMNDLLKGVDIKKDGDEERAEQAAVSFDKDVAIQKAEREQRSRFQAARKEMQATQTACTTLMNKVRAEAHSRNTFMHELKTIDNRLRWVHLVLTGDRLGLQALIQAHSETEVTEGQAVGSHVFADSRSLGEVRNTPPIMNFEKLLTLDEVMEEGQHLVDCTTQAELEEKTKELEASVNLILELKAATSFCKDDLVNAQSTHAKEVKQAAAKIAKEKAKNEKNKQDKPEIAPRSATT